MLAQINIKFVIISKWIQIQIVHLIMRKPIAKRKMYVRINFLQRVRHAHGGRVVELREAIEWQRCARRESGGGARNDQVREAGEWRRCARRVSGGGAQGGRVTELHEAGEWRRWASFLGYFVINLLVSSSYLHNASMQYWQCNSMFSARITNLPVFCNTVYKLFTYTVYTISLSSQLLM